MFIYKYYIFSTFLFCKLLRQVKTPKYKIFVILKEGIQSFQMNNP